MPEDRPSSIVHRRSTGWKLFARTVAARAYPRLVMNVREKWWMLFDIALPLIGVCAYVFIYRANNAPAELIGFVIVGGAMSAYWLNVLWSMGNQLFWEKENGNLALYIMAPNSLMAVLLGMALGGMFTTSIRALSILTIGSLLFDVQYAVSSVPQLAAVFVIALVALYGMGMMFASAFLLLGREGWHLVNLAQEPVFLLSGMFFPIRSFNFWVAAGASIIPLTLAMDAIRQLSFSIRCGARVSRRSGGDRACSPFSACCSSGRRGFCCSGSSGWRYRKGGSRRAAGEAAYVDFSQDSHVARMANRVELGLAGAVCAVFDHQAADFGGDHRRHVRHGDAARLRIAGVFVHVHRQRVLHVRGRGDGRHGAGRRGRSRAIQDAQVDVCRAYQHSDVFDGARRRAVSHDDDVCRDYAGVRCGVPAASGDGGRCAVAAVPRVARHRRGAAGDDGTGAGEPCPDDRERIVVRGRGRRRRVVSVLRRSVSIAALPEWLRPVGYLMPVTYWLELVRRSLAGGGVGDYSGFGWIGDLQLVALLAALTVALGAMASAMFFRCDHIARERGLIDQNDELLNRQFDSAAAT